MDVTAVRQSGVCSGVRVGPLARLCLWAGLLGAASGVFLATVSPAVADDRYSYPLSALGFVLIQCWFVVQHGGLLAGLVALERSGATGGPRLGLRAAAVGMVLLTLTEVLAIAAARSNYSGLLTGVLDALYGVSTLVIGMGLVGAGVAVLRARVWIGWRRWVPLLTGAYVFVPMMPLMFAGFLGARLAITGWMLLFALLGWVLAHGRPS